MPRTLKLPPLAARRHVSPEDLDVAAALVGLPLAAPSRRLVAIGIDVAVVGLLSSLGNVWLLMACVAMLALHSRYRDWAPRGARRPLAWGLAVTLLAIGAQQAWVERHSPAEAEEAADTDEAVTLDHLAHLPPDAAAWVASAASVTDATRAARAASAATVSSAAGIAGTPTISAAERIADLQEQLAEARRPPPFDLRRELGRWSEEFGIGFGWAIVYFSMVPVWLPGQTLGKRLLGLRVVELTGKPLTAMLCLKRYGGYAAGMATGLLGFAQVLWDSNRQAIQDKTAHTVVIDLRGARRTDA